MRVLEVLISVSWILFWVYWFAEAIRQGSHFGETSHRKARAIFIIVVLLVVYSVRGSNLGHITYPHNTSLRILGAALFYAGLATAIWARVNLGASWGMPMSAQHNPKLVTSGPYRYIRHPIYSGLLLAFLGSALTLSKIWAVIFLVSLVFIVYSSVEEERYLDIELPKQYPEYKKRTKMLIPKIL